MLEQYGLIARPGVVSIYPAKHPFWVSHVYLCVPWNLIELPRDSEGSLQMRHQSLLGRALRLDGLGSTTRDTLISNEYLEITRDKTLLINRAMQAMNLEVYEADGALKPLLQLPDGTELEHLASEITQNSGWDWDSRVSYMPWPTTIDEEHGKVCVPQIMLLQAVSYA